MALGPALLERFFVNSENVILTDGADDDDLEAKAESSAADRVGAVPVGPVEADPPWVPDMVADVGVRAECDVWSGSVR